MLAWSCRARGGEEKAIDVDLAVQLEGFYSINAPQQMRTTRGT